MERLRQSPRLALRAVLSVQLQAVSAAAARLAAGEDDEALHDFRVALRRLHTLLRVYRDDLDHRFRMINKQLRRLARATNALRDREVHIAWLCEQQRQTPVTPLGVLIEQLKAEQDRAMRRACPQVLTQFNELATRLHRALRAPADARGRRAQTTLSFAQAAARRLRELGNKLARRLAKIDPADADDERVHAARIAGKRLRYVMEPLSSAIPGAQRLLTRLRALQDLLGDIHDCQLRIRDLDDAALVQDAAERARLRRLAKEKHAALVQELEGQWLGSRIDPLLAPLWRVIARLSCVERHSAARRLATRLKRR